ncbi:GNVR domain-containing protein [Sphingomonas profundi]|uniref:GNVR domain-containing protein n=1 Tax=Alterirhizorhabdus profundi TaxID=2681549 RepID=UPI0012E7E4CA|nr:GNVR domain-containing protein [Sphingomonas profundi]
MLLPVDLLAAIRVRWRLEVAILAAVMLLVLVWIALSPRSYVASASLLFEDRRDPVEDVAAAQENITALLATQADVLQSEAIATGVARSLNLAASPEATESWRRSTGGVGDINAWMGRQLLPSLDVVPERSSRVLTIRYKSADPNSAAAIANTFASSYLDARLRLETDPARTYSRWFEDRTREVRLALEQAQGRLTAFQRKTGIVDVGPANTDSARLAELAGQLTSAEAAAADIGARAGRSAAQSPEVLSSGVVQGLRSQIAAKTAQVSQLSTEFGPNHPARQAAEAELAALRGKLASETGAAANSVGVASGAAAAKESDLRGRVEAQRGRMLGMAQERAQLDVLQRDVDSARAAYDAVTQKLGTMRLQSAAPTTNVRQLDTATPPLFPATPNMPLRFLLGTVLGLLLAIGTAVLLELLRPRVRTAAGIQALGGVPVVARIDFQQSRVAGLLQSRPGL